MPNAFRIQVPQDAVFHIRVAADNSPGFVWSQLGYADIFQGRRVAIVALPGAWTPTCSSTHLPGFSASYDRLKDAGLDEVYCLSVNDSFTMNAWFNHLNIKNVVPLPDGNGDFSRKMGFLVHKHNLGFGDRSWRYSMVVNDGTVEMMWIESGLSDNASTDPFSVSDAYTMLEWLEKSSAG
jgi:peroxiredoxin